MHTPHDDLRYLEALFLAGMGAYQILQPRSFTGVSQYFKWAPAFLAPVDRTRLERAIQARERAEGVSVDRTRLFGLVGLIMAPLVFVHGIPFALPWAGYCLAVACTILLVYLQVRRATRRRAAPLARRQPLDTLAPRLVYAVYVSLIGTLTFAVFPQYRLAAIGVALSVLVLFAIAWRIAIAPALLQGDDPQIEYAVDQRVRFGRAAGIALLACVTAYGFVSVATLQTQSTNDTVMIAYTVVRLAVAAAFIVAMYATSRSLRQPLTMA
jgi:hypothetical protein